MGERVARTGGEVRATPGAVGVGDERGKALRATGPVKGGEEGGRIAEGGDERGE